MPTGWDDSRSNVLSWGQPKPPEIVGYRRGCWWIEECIVRDEANNILGRLTSRTLISPAWQEQPLQRIGLPVVDFEHPTPSIDQYLYRGHQR